MTGIAALKAQARQAAFAARKLAFAQGQGQAAAILADLLSEYGARPLAGYMAMRTEIDPTEAMAAHPGVVGVPVIMGAGQALRFREWTPGCAMVDGPFGAQVPTEGAWIEPEVLIVPLVAWDRRGYRLGYGGGFYDRTLEGLRTRRPTLAVGFAFAAQELPEVPVESIDQPLDAIVTEAGVLRFS
ncbi:5-formyltetrahydrofolate cyclo-ligase [Gemmobacter serpentinus]|uniref:5-formyltetrahydrofolate cyclo-ligase n=1 Tax=Gemmobacter serpentinus TaxID=2652247 RepID=UPI00124DE8E4|nr:5-formyltetrahydrofolate cyclo-ligase [Gemmobacter serpentinus]